MHSSPEPRGQVLVIAAGAMVVLVGIGAIVLDLGMSWMLHRQEQNAADPGSLAAAQWVPSGNHGQMNAEACFYAQQNGFFVGDAGCAAALAAGDLDVNSPPVSAMAGNFQGRPGFVEVIIRDTHPSFFGQFFGRPTAVVATAAVATLTDGNSNSSSLIALGGSCSGADDGSSEVNGGAEVHIFPASGVTTPGGFVNVNAPCGSVLNPNLCDANGNSNALAVVGHSVLSAPHFFVVGAWAESGGGDQQCLGGAPTCLDEQAIPLGDPLEQLPEPWPFLQGSLAVPACPDPAEINSPSDQSPCTLRSSGGGATCPGVCTMSPGVYYAGWDIKGSTQVVMKPGMYVFAGFGIQMSAQASLTSVTDVDGAGNPIEARVTIFSTEHTPGCEAGQQNFCEGPIRIQSSGLVSMSATNGTTCQQVSTQICPWAGILLWQDDTVIGDSEEVTITAQSALRLAGTIYAPESEVTLAGGNNTSGCAGSGNCLAIQVISQNWKITGGANVEMPYDPNELYQLEQRGLVH
jgi:hypothetical protein